MTLPREACKEDSQESDPQYLPPGYNNQAAPSSITEEPVSLKVT